MKHLMMKPIGPKCNLDCDYCFYKEKKEIYPNPEVDMKVLELYLEEYIQDSPQIFVGWQGGEPTLAGLDYYKQALKFEENYPDTIIINYIQTNGINLSEKWCKFLGENNFLVGISLDGPRELHNTFRKDTNGIGTYNRVIGAIRRLKKYNVEFNVLCTVNSANVHHNLYDFFRYDIDIDYLRLIPIVDKKEQVKPGEYGDFLIRMYDRWLDDDKSLVVDVFNHVENIQSDNPSDLCIFAERCGDLPILEHNGDVYPCDHFVLSDNCMGNIKKEPLKKIYEQASEPAKLQARCLACTVKGYCNSECPKNKMYLCEDYKKFFTHTQHFE